MTVQDIPKEYFAFIHENSYFHQLTESHTEIVTPFVDNHGEGISFSCFFDGKYYTISDDGFTLFNLGVYGIDLDKKGNRKTLLNSLLRYNGFFVNDKKEITKTVSKKELGQTIHDMTQLLINVYDFNFLHPQTVYTQ